MNKCAFISQEFGNRKDGDGFNLNEYGHTANIVVPAKKGKATMWYNYELDENCTPKVDEGIHFPDGLSTDCDWCVGSGWQCIQECHFKIK